MKVMQLQAQNACVLQSRVRTPLLADALCSRELVAARCEDERGRRTRGRRSCLAPRNGARALRLSVVEGRTPLTPYAAHAGQLLRHMCPERERSSRHHTQPCRVTRVESVGSGSTAHTRCRSQAHHIALKHAIKVRRRPTATRQRRVGAAPMREQAARRVRPVCGAQT